MRKEKLDSASFWTAILLDGAQVEGGEFLQESAKHDCPHGTKYNENVVKIDNAVDEAAKNKKAACAK